MRRKRADEGGLDCVLACRPPPTSPLPSPAAPGCPWRPSTPYSIIDFGPWVRPHSGPTWAPGPSGETSTLGEGSTNHRPHPFLPRHASCLRTSPCPSCLPHATPARPIHAVGALT